MKMNFPLSFADYNGHTNAFTAPDRTVYMFSSNTDGFPLILESFSRFFIDPLFNPSGISREMHAVDQEFSKNIEHDGWRSYMVFKETGNPDHPNAMFSTGNSQTLANIPQSALKKWHEAYYTASNMRLALYSSLPLDELKTAAASLFAQAPARASIETPPFPQELFSSGQKGRMTYIKPIKQRRSLELSWELPRSLSLSNAKPAQLIAYGLQRGQSLSLRELLKKEGLVEDLSIGVDKLGNPAHRFFGI